MHYGEREGWDVCTMVRGGMWVYKQNGERESDVCTMVREGGGIYTMVGGRVIYTLW